MQVEVSQDESSGAGMMIRMLTAVLAIVATTTTVSMCGQNNAAAAPVEGKAWTFEVVSIRENKSAAVTRMPKFGPTANGYQAENFPALGVIVTAYVPQVGGRAFYQQKEIVGVPDWLMSARFDIDARVSEADLDDWKKPVMQEVMLRSMLQALLTERFGLKVHRETKETSVYSLVVGKGGSKLKETDPEAKHAGGMTMPGGAVVSPEFKDGKITLNIYGISMPIFATFLANSTGRPVEDKTGLTGRYDVLQIQAPSGANPSPVTGATTDDGPSVFSVVEGLGLKLEPTKGLVETLVFDHVERPSAN